MPGFLVREQFKADSVRAFYYFKLRNDSSLIKKYLKKNRTAADTSVKGKDLRITVKDKKATGNGKRNIALLMMPGLGTTAITSAGNKSHNENNYERT
jgi:hypothetical protein